MVVRDRPVARETNDTPPEGSDLASAAAHTRRPRSSNTPRRTRYFALMAPSSFRSMRQEYTIYHNLYKLFMRTPLSSAFSPAAPPKKLVSNPERSSSA